MCGIYENCPNGHESILNENDTPWCPDCDLIATHYNARSGQVFEWTDMDEYHANCERLQNAMDEAFDNTYFSGW